MPNEKRLDDSPKVSIMNYSLLEEIISLKQNGRNNTEIADLIGSNKTIVTIALRVYHEVDKHHREVMDELSKTNTSLIEQVKHHKELISLCEQQITELSHQESAKLVEEKKELVKKVEGLEEYVEDLEDRIFNLTNEPLMEIIKRRFFRGV